MEPKLLPAIQSHSEDDEDLEVICRRHAFIEISGLHGNCPYLEKACTDVLTLPPRWNPIITISFSSTTFEASQRFLLETLTICCRISHVRSCRLLNVSCDALISISGLIDAC
jgi:hypothetical protein